MTRTKKIVLAAGLAAFAIASVVVLLNLGPLLRGKVERDLSARWNTPVRIGSLEISLKEGMATLTDVEMGDPSGPDEAPLGQAKLVRLPVAWSGAFGGDVPLSGMRVDGAILHLESTSDGRASAGQFFANRTALADKTQTLRDIEIKDLTVHLRTPETPRGIIATVERLTVDGATPSADAWPNAVIETVTVHPKDAVEHSASRDLAAAGFQFDRAEGAFLLAGASDPVRLRAVKVNGLRVRSKLAPEGRETLADISNAVRACIGESAKDGLGIVIEDVALDRTKILLEGSDAKGRRVLARVDAAFEGQGLGFGPRSAEVRTPSRLKVIAAQGSEATRFELDADADGSSLERLLDLIGHGPRETPIVVDADIKPLELVIREKASGITTARFGRLNFEGLTFPAKDQPASREAWTKIRVERLVLRAPGLADRKSPEAVDEGLDFELAEGELNTPGKPTGPLLLRGVVVRRFNARALLHANGDADSISRLANTLMRAFSNKRFEGIMGDGGVFVKDARMSEAIFRFDGAGADGRMGHWGLVDAGLDATELAFGPSAVPMQQESGAVGLHAMTQSSEGPGKVLMKWNEIRGAWPALTFNGWLEASGVALAPWNAKVKQESKMGVERGTLAGAFRGGAKDGQLSFAGKISLSKDLSLKGNGVTDSIKADLAKILKPESIDDVRIVGTLEKPEVKLPDSLAGGAFDLFDAMLLNKDTGLFGALGLGSSGGGRKKSGFERVPVIGPIGGILTGSEKEEKKPDEQR